MLNQQQTIPLSIHSELYDLLIPKPIAPKND